MTPPAATRLATDRQGWALVLVVLALAACTPGASEVDSAPPADSGHDSDPSDGVDSNADDSGADTADSAAPPPVDADGDGFLSDVDCDDSRAEVHPGAEELCNGRDDDCDGTTDACDISQDATTLYVQLGGDELAWPSALTPDITGDGAADLLVWKYGYREYSEYPYWEYWDIASYVIPSERMTRGGGVRVEDVALAVYARTDATTYGIAGSGDIDGDGHAELQADPFPGETTITLYSGFAVTHQGSAAFEAVDWTIDFAATGLSDYPVPRGDLDSDGLDDLSWLGDPATPGTALLFLSGARITGGGATTSDPSWEIRDPSGAPYELFAVGAAGDVDGDGAPDLMAGADGWDASCTGCNGGATAWVISGATLASVGSVHLPDADWAVNSGNRFTRALLTIVGSLGDIDGDGRDDVAIRGRTVQGEDNESLIGGAVDLGSSVTLADDWGLQIGDASEYLGGEVVHGDFDGDGRHDVAVGLGRGPGYNDMHFCIFTADLLGGGGTLTSADPSRRYDYRYGDRWLWPPADDLDGDGQDDLVLLTNDEPGIIEVVTSDGLF